MGRWECCEILTCNVWLRETRFLYWKYKDKMWMEEVGVGGWARYTARYSQGVAVRYSVTLYVAWMTTEMSKLSDIGTVGRLWCIPTCISCRSRKRLAVRVANTGRWRLISEEFWHCHWKLTRTDSYCEGVICGSPSSLAYPSTGWASMRRDVFFGLQFKLTNTLLLFFVKCNSCKF